VALTIPSSWVELLEVESPKHLDLCKRCFKSFVAFVAQNQNLMEDDPTSLRCSNSNLDTGNIALRLLRVGDETKRASYLRICFQHFQALFHLVQALVV